MTGAAVLAGEIAEHIDALAREVHAALAANGNHDADSSMPDWAFASLKASLIAGEALELEEEFRAGTERQPSSKIPEFTREEDEVADIILRALDFAALRGHRVGAAIAAKTAFNATRPRAHGGKRF